jgi:hypothetical protein
MIFNFETAAKEAQRKVVAEMAANGRVTPFDFSEDVRSGRVTIKEMIGTADGAAEFLEKITFDLASGQSQVPLVYQDIYTTLTDPNFPLDLTEKTIGDVQTVFLEKFEGGEIAFGAVGSGRSVSVHFHTYAAGIEYDEDIAEYNQTWRVASIGESFGRSYNMLLNHLHLSAITQATYATGTAYNASQSTLLAAARAQKGFTNSDGSVDYGTAQNVVGDLSNPATWKAVVQILPRGSVILHNSFDTIAIQSALAQDVLVVGNTNQPGVANRRLSNATFIPYDGDIITVGQDVYTYTGVPQGTAFVLVPKVNFKEYVKHDLRTDSGDGDLSRLVLSQVVGRTRRTLLAAVGGEFGALKISAS